MSFTHSTAVVDPLIGGSSPCGRAAEAALPGRGRRWHPRHPGPATRRAGGVSAATCGGDDELTAGAGHQQGRASWLAQGGWRPRPSPRWHSGLREPQHAMLRGRRTSCRQTAAGHRDGRQPATQWCGVATGSCPTNTTRSPSNTTSPLRSRRCLPSRWPTHPGPDSFVRRPRIRARTPRHRVLPREIPRLTTVRSSRPSCATASGDGLGLHQHQIAAAPLGQGAVAFQSQRSRAPYGDHIERQSLAHRPAAGCRR